VLQLCPSRHALRSSIQLNPGLMDVSRSTRNLDLADSKENKQAGRVGYTSAENPSKLLILCKLAERVGFEPSFNVVLCS